MTAPTGRPWGPKTVDPIRLLSRLDGSDRAIARRLGVTHQTLKDWRAGRKRMGRFNADEFAVIAGHHPAYIWPEEFGGWDRKHELMGEAYPTIHSEVDARLSGP
jgi:hypothetical protein